MRRTSRIVEVLGEVVGEAFLHELFVDEEELHFVVAVLLSEFLLDAGRCGRRTGPGGLKYLATGALMALSERLEPVVVPRPRAYSRS